MRYKARSVRHRILITLGKPEAFGQFLTFGSLGMKAWMLRAVPIEPTIVAYMFFSIPSFPATLSLEP